MTIRNATRNTMIAQEAVKADTFLKRMRGLLGRAFLATGEALVIVPCQSVHMLFMRFAIDVVFLDRNNRVAGLCVGLQPFSFSPVFWKSACAIELPAGTIKKTNTCIGDHIHLPKV